MSLVIQKNPSALGAHSSSQAKQKASPLDQLPISVNAVRVPTNVAQSKKLRQLVEKMPHINSQDIKHIAHSFNNTPKGAIITDDLIQKAITGLNFDGKQQLQDIQNDPSTQKLDAFIGDKTKELMALNTLSIVLDPETISDIEGKTKELPIPSVNSQSQNIDKFISDDQQFIETMLKFLPDIAHGTLDNNMTALGKNSSEKGHMSPTNIQLQSTSPAVKNKINQNIEKLVAEIYQLTAIRLLTTLGNSSAGAPDISQSFMPRS